MSGKEYSYITDKSRKVIVLSPCTLATILIYEHGTNFEEIGLMERDEVDYSELMHEAAREFIRQLEDHWCVRFMEALVEEINILLKRNIAQRVTVKEKK